MTGHQWTRRTAMGLGLAGALALGACGKIPMTVDTPKDGDTVLLQVSQPMQVRWGNLVPDKGEWVLETTPAAGVLSAGPRTVKPPANGSQQLEVFDFTAAKKGREDVTFVFRHKDGQAPTSDERVNIHVTVS